eukprot:m51a1_g8602 hypothetical protein (1236) ;mRNA; r:160372-185436
MEPPPPHFKTLHGFRLRPQNDALWARSQVELAVYLEGSPSVAYSGPQAYPGPGRPVWGAFRASVAAGRGVSPAVPVVLQLIVTDAQGTRCLCKGPRSVALALPGGMAGEQWGAVDFGVEAGQAEQQLTRQTKNLSVLVGVNGNRLGELLQGATNDVALMKAWTRATRRHRANELVLLGERATRQAIEDSLVWMAEEAQRGDSLLFYFSGLGTTCTAPQGSDKLFIPARPTACLCPADVADEEPNYRLLSSVDVAELLYPALVKGATVTLVLDCSFTDSNWRRVKHLHLPTSVPEEAKMTAVINDFATVVDIVNGLTPGAQLNYVARSVAEPQARDTVSIGSVLDTMRVGAVQGAAAAGPEEGARWVDIARGAQGFGAGIAEAAKKASATRDVALDRAALQALEGMTREQWAAVARQAIELEPRGMGEVVDSVAGGLDASPARRRLLLRSLCDAAIDSAILSAGASTRDWATRDLALALAAGGKGLREALRGLTTQRKLQLLDTLLGNKGQATYDLYKRSTNSTLVEERITFVYVDGWLSSGTRTILLSRDEYRLPWVCFISLTSPDANITSFAIISQSPVGDALGISAVRSACSALTARDLWDPTGQPIKVAQTRSSRDVSAMVTTEEAKAKEQRRWRAAEDPVEVLGQLAYMALRTLVAELARWAHMTAELAVLVKSGPSVAYSGQQPFPASDDTRVWETFRASIALGDDSPASTTVSLTLFLRDAPGGAPLLCQGEAPFSDLPWGRGCNVALTLGTDGTRWGDVVFFVEAGPMEGDPQQLQTRQSRYLSVLVGINSTGRGYDLHGAVNDVSLMQMWTSVSRRSTDDERVLLQGDATHERIVNSLLWMRNEARRGDSLLFFYSGQGTTHTVPQGSTALGIPARPTACLCPRLPAIQQSVLAARRTASANGETSGPARRMCECIAVAAEQAGRTVECPVSRQLWATLRTGVQQAVDDTEDEVGAWEAMVETWGAVEREAAGKVFGERRMWSAIVVEAAEEATAEGSRESVRKLVLSLESRCVVLVRVPRSPARPHKCKGVYYVRTESGKRDASTHELVGILVETGVIRSNKLPGATVLSLVTLTRVSLEWAKVSVAESRSATAEDALCREITGGVPYDAFREVLTNAVAHRDYTISSNIRVFVTPKRVVVRSPGLPINGNVSTIERGLHMPRNPAIYQVMTAFKLVTNSGLGLVRAKRALAERGLPPPLVEVVRVEPGGIGEVVVTLFAQQPPIV